MKAFKCWAPEYYTIHELGDMGECDKYAVEIKASCAKYAAQKYVRFYKDLEDIGHGEVVWVKNIATNKIYKYKVRVSAVVKYTAKKI